MVRESPSPVSPLCPTPVEPAEAACEASEDESVSPRPQSSPIAGQPMPIPQQRRKSAAWRGFNLKRQLSKVDMKLKHTFSTSEKRTSVFYAPEPLEISPNELTEDSDGDKASPDSEEIDTPEECTAEEETPATVVLAVGSLGSNVDKRVGFSAMRPDNLALVDEHGNPVRPPRHKKKVLDKRDQRLLSVPNIKFTKPEVPNMHDLRDVREQISTTSGNNPPPPQASFTGNLMRRFSKSQLCAVLPLLLHRFNTPFIFICLCLSTSLPV